MQFLFLHGVLFCVICVFLCVVLYCSTIATGTFALQFNNNNNKNNNLRPQYHGT
jgi:hypothetical protein